MPRRRLIAATRAAENGATVAQLEGIFGWKGGTDGLALYRDSKPQAACARRHAYAGERKGKIYAPT